MYYHNTNPVAFGTVAMLFCGITGCFTLSMILSQDIAFGLAKDQSLIFTIVRIAFAGIFSYTGYLTYFMATSKGSVEVTQLFSNMKSIVQLIEEFLFLNILPDFLSVIGN